MSLISAKKQECPLRIYAHRGSNRIFPENTLPAFAHALEEQATHLEMDLHCTQDGHIVVVHDADGKRIAGVDKSIKECSLAEIQSWDLIGPFLALKSKESAKGAGDLSKQKSPEIEAKQRRQLKNCRIATFEETLNTFSKVIFNVEIKDHRPEVIEKVVQLIHQRKDEKRVLLHGYRPLTLKYLRRIPYKGQIAVSPGFVFGMLCCPPVLWPWLNIPGDFLQVPMAWNRIKLDRSRIVNCSHALGKRVDYWTINDPEEVLRLLHLGADGVISDDISAIKDAVFTFARQNNRAMDYA